MTFTQGLTQWWRQVRANGWFGPVNSSDPALVALFGRPPVSSGVQVDEQKALTYSIVWACVQLIAGSLGSLPLIHYRRLANGGKERFTESRLYRLLHDAPNDEMSASTWAETLCAAVLLWGNAFAEIRRDNRGQVGALWPIEPWRVQGKRENGVFLYYLVDGQTRLAPEEMLHIPGLTPDGIWGYSPIQKAREAIGLGLASEKFGGTFFGQGSSFGGILTHPGRLNEQAEQKLRASLEARAQGVDRAHNFIILQEGMRYDKIGIPPNDAQFLETRKFQVTEIARWFGVPPHMVGDVERSTSWGTGIESQNIGFVTYTLRRWLVRFEQEITRKLISPLERNLQFVEFLVDGLLRGDTTTRYQAYQVGRNGGWFSANDIRRLENMDPIGADGDRYLVPMNFQPADEIPSIKEKIEALGGLIRAGYDPAASLEALGLPPIPHDGAPPVTVQPLDNYPGAAARGGGGLRPGLPSANGEAPNGPTEEAPPSGRALAELVAHVQAFMARQEREPLPLDPAIFVERTVEEIKALPAPPPADLTPVLEKLEALEQDRRAHDDQMAAIRPDVQLWIEDVARGFVRRETDRAARAAATPDKLAAWMEEFYPRQADYAVKEFLRAMKVFTRLVGRPEDAERDIRTHVGDYVQESRAALGGLLALPPEDMKVAVAHLTGRWEAERPAELARALMAGSVGRPAPAPRLEVERPAPTPAPEPEPEPEPVSVVVDKQILERDGAGRAQRARETHEVGGDTLIVEKVVLERDAAGRAQRIREVHTRQKGTSHGTQPETQ